MERSEDADERLDLHFPDRRLEPGQLGTTPGAQDALTHEEIITALARHLAGDWGDVDEHDWQESELSLEKDFRLLSTYHTEGGVKFWILTEADRSHTIEMLPEESRPSDRDAGPGRAVSSR